MCCVVQDGAGVNVLLGKNTDQWLKVGYNGPEQTTKTEQGIGQHIELVERMRVQAILEMDNDFCSNFI